MTKIDTATLPYGQYATLEVLAARYRGGEQAWTFPPNARPHLRKLEDLGLVGWKAGTQPRTVLAWLTDAGKAAALSPTFQPKATISVATASTRHWDFMAIGVDEQDARAALMHAWRLHAADTGADPDHLSEVGGDINVVTAPIGQAFRDGSPYPRTGAAR